MKKNILESFLLCYFTCVSSYFIGFVQRTNFSNDDEQVVQDLHIDLAKIEENIKLGKLKKQVDSNTFFDDCKPIASDISKTLTDAENGIDTLNEKYEEFIKTKEILFKEYRNSVEKKQNAKKTKFKQQLNENKLEFSRWLKDCINKVNKFISVYQRNKICVINDNTSKNVANFLDLFSENMKKTVKYIDDVMIKLNAIAEKNGDSNLITLVNSLIQKYTQCSRDLLVFYSDCLNFDLSITDKNNSILESCDLIIEKYTTILQQCYEYEKKIS